jgi:hypothetical protein
MAVQKTQISYNRRKPVLHLIGTAAGDSSTILLTDLLLSDETSSSSIGLTVNIAQAYVNCNDNVTSGITVRRGGSSGTIVLDMHGSSEYPQQLAWPSLNQNNTSSIFINFAGPGMICLELHKLDGYVEPTTNRGV